MPGILFVQAGKTEVFASVAKRYEDVDMIRPAKVTPQLIAAWDPDLIVFDVPARSLFHFYPLIEKIRDRVKENMRIIFAEYGPDSSVTREIGARQGVSIVQMGSADDAAELILDIRSIADDILHLSRRDVTFRVAAYHRSKDLVAALSARRLVAG